MNDKDRFAIWFSETTLRVADDEIELIALQDMKARAHKASDLDAVLSATNLRRPGDFGVEIIGAALSTFCILIGRQLWESYTKNLVDRAGKELADLTVEKFKGLILRIWRGDDPAMDLDQIESMVRNAATQTSLETTDVDHLVEVLRSDEMKQAMLAQ